MAAENPESAARHLYSVRAGNASAAPPQLALIFYAEDGRIVGVSEPSGIGSLHAPFRR